MHPVVRDVDQLVRSTQEIGSNQQQLQLNQQQQQLDQKHMVQTVERMENEHAAAFDRLIKNQAKVYER